MALRFAVSMLAVLPSVMGRPTPQIPSVDPFYQPPKGFEDQDPGSILRTRKIQASFFGIIPDFGIETHQLLYRTRSINGSAIAATTTVFKPKRKVKFLSKVSCFLSNHLCESGDIKDEFVSFHTAYDGSSTICDPSYNYQQFATQRDIISAAEMPLLQAFLLKGYIVSSPDYEGPEAAFAASRLEGFVTLDSMRAVSKFSPLGFKTNKPVIVGYGYSGGAIATGWAASLQPSYAPELPIRGWAYGGTPANLQGTFKFIDGTVNSGFLPAAWNGLLKPSAYGESLQPFVNKAITPFGKGVLDYANDHCAVADILGFTGGSLLTTEFQSKGDQLLNDPVISDILEQSRMGANKDETPTAPVFMFHSEHDEIIPYHDASDLVDTWCTNGASVEFVTFANGGHATGEMLGVIPAFKFIKTAFAGTVATGCSRRTELDNAFSPLALGADLEPLLGKLLNSLVHLFQKNARV